MGLVRRADPRRGRPAPARRDRRRRRTRGDEFVVDYRIRRPDGVIRWIETRGRELEGGDWIGVSIDVTDKRIAEDALREANDRLEETVARLDTLLANAPLGFAFYDRETPLRRA